MNGALDGNRTFSLMFQSEEKALATIQQLSALCDQEHEYGLEDKGKTDRDGRQEFKLTDWPGKPKSSFGGGGGGGKGAYQLRYPDTQEGFLEKEKHIFRSVALQEAARFLNDQPDAQADDVVSYANAFYNWLIQGIATQSQPALPSPAAAVDSSGPPPKPNTSFQRPPCPKCGNDSAVRQSKDRKTGEYIPGAFYCYRKLEGCGHEWKDLGELAAQLGVKRGDQIESKVEAAEKHIAKALKDKDLELLRKIEQRVVERLDDGSMSVDDAGFLDQKIQAARKAIQSGNDQAQWHTQKVQEAQQKLFDEHGKEIGAIPEGECPF